MNEKEKQEFYVAMCRCCLIAQAMKTCPLCRFNTGLVEKVTPVVSEFALIPIQIPMLAMAEQC